MACYIPFFLLWGVVFLEDRSVLLTNALAGLAFGQVLDYALHRAHGGKPNWQSALITSGIVVLLLPFAELWQVLLTLILALGSKHLVRFKGGHIFNPASFGLAIGTLLFGYSLGWLPDSFVWVTVALGLANVWRVRKFTQVLSFLAAYLVLITIEAGVVPTTDLAWTSPGFQSLALALPWFFAFFMVPEPVTSLQPRRRQIEFGVLVAAAAFLATQFDLTDDAALLWGLLSANLYARIVK